MPIRCHIHHSTYLAATSLHIYHCVLFYHISNTLSLYWCCYNFYSLNMFSPVRPALIFMFCLLHSNFLSLVFLLWPNLIDLPLSYPIQSFWSTLSRLVFLHLPSLWFYRLLYLPFFNLYLLCSSPSVSAMINSTCLTLSCSSRYCLLGSDWIVSIGSNLFFDPQGFLILFKITYH